MNRRKTASARGQAASPPRRVVLDLPLLLGALLLSTPEAKAWRAAWQQGRVQLLISAAFAQLLMRSLAHPGLQLGADDQQELLADVLPYAEVVELPAQASGRARQGLTPDQSAAVDLALAGQAERLVSDQPGLHQWTASRRTKAARQLCTVCVSTDWDRV